MVQASKKQLCAKGGLPCCHEVANRLTQQFGSDLLMPAFHGANGKRKEKRQCFAPDWMKIVTEWRKEGPNNLIKSGSCIWQLKTKMFPNLITRMWEATFEEQFQEVSGSHEGSKVGTPQRNLVVMGWVELSLEGKAVLRIVFCCLFFVLRMATPS